MLRIGLTGGLGSGKTTVSKIFESLSVPVFYADDAAKSIMNDNKEVKKQLIHLFGKQAYNQTLNRKYIADIVFNDAYKLEQLNAIVHPLTIHAAAEWMQQHTAKPYVIKEAALMFESRSAINLDYVIGVYAPQSLRVLRAMKRDNTSKEQVLARINKQIDETIKIKLCDFVIVNDDVQALLPQVLALHEKLLITNNQNERIS